MSDADLVLPDYDDLTLPDLTHRVRTLDAGELRDVVRYEEEHANRLPVLQVLHTRLEQLDSGSEPSGGPHGGPEHHSGSAQSQETVSPQTSGPAMNPPSQGNPTNPAQPRT